jgi:hypothetical protein
MTKTMTSASAVGTGGGHPKISRNSVIILWLGILYLPGLPCIE